MSYYSKNGLLEDSVTVQRTKQPW